MSLQDDIKQAEEQAQKDGYANSGEGWFSNKFKFQEGDNVIRILSKPEIFFEKFKTGICYTNCGYQGTARFMTWILDRKDNQIKLATLPYMIGTVIAKYETDEDYSFEDFPMPYDIKINAKNAGTKEVEYTPTPRPKREEISQEVITQLQEKKPVPEIISILKEKKKEEHVASGQWQAEQDRREALKKEIQEAREAINENEDYPENDLGEQVF